MGTCQQTREALQGPECEKERLKLKRSDKGEITEFTIIVLRRSSMGEVHEMIKSHLTSEW